MLFTLKDLKVNSHIYTRKHASIRDVMGAKYLDDTKEACKHAWVPNVVLNVQRCMCVCMHGDYQLGSWLLARKLERWVRAVGAS